jgi:phosphoglycerate transport regulatory protein PgtC
LITFQLDPLKKATKAVHDAEAALAKKPNAEGTKLAIEARELINQMPLTEAEASSSDIAQAFRGGGGNAKAPRQAELEQAWATFAKTKYADAAAKAEAALKLAR